MLNECVFYGDKKYIYKKKCFSIKRKKIIRNFLCPIFFFFFYIFFFYSKKQKNADITFHERKGVQMVKEAFPCTTFHYPSTVILRIGKFYDGIVLSDLFFSFSFQFYVSPFVFELSLFFSCIYKRKKKQFFYKKWNVKLRWKNFFRWSFKWKHISPEQKQL